MYINDTHIAYYAVFAIIGLFVGMFVDWMNKRLPDYKKVFSKELFTEYFAEFKPNYILMFVTAAIYVALLYFYGIKNTTKYARYWNEGSHCGEHCWHGG